MEDEIEDLVGDVRCTDSQKSVTTSNAYSPDFTDSSSDKNQSSGKDTYVIDWDDSDDSDKTFQIHHDPSIIDLKTRIENETQKQNLDSEPKTINKSVCASIHKCTIVSNEICTQTSKTIFELVAKETDLHVTRDSRTLQTQTSFLSVTENKTIEYKIEVKSAQESSTRHESLDECSEECQQESENTISQEHDSQNPNISQEDSSTKYPESETQNEITEDASSESTFSDRVIQFIDAESHENIPTRDIDKNSCDLESSKFDSDIEEDSLMLNESQQDNTNKIVDSISDTSVPKSVDNDVEELYNKMSESVDLFSPEMPVESNLRRFGTLTPLTEETMPKKDSIIDVTPSMKTFAKPVENDTKNSPLVNNSGMRPSVSADSNMNNDKFKLPPIHNKSCPNSPNLNFLFAINAPIHGNGHTIVEERETLLDRWDRCTRYLAGGESPLISGRSDPVRNEMFRLPPIHVEGIIQNNNNSVQYFTTSRIENTSKESSMAQGSINIKDKIRELKRTERKNRHATSRAGSPSSTASPDETKLCDVAERGGEALCAELLRKLRSTSWMEVADTLEEIPHVMVKFWNVVTENRIADLIRQDFYEAITALLSKTGSLSRPVRRAANVALDDIVSITDLSLAVTALCVNGVSHKSALVRCAAARLLVVCCALAEGGRLLLRGRPPSAAAARRHALRALAMLLDDKNIETRKYAERLFFMLRPLTNFEAYFLTDVDVELAARQMKKFDQIQRTPKTR
ncbi:uncharacterized protein [Epargyreus clarus]|uniref:uncharacterized protein isoform X2 n=1 Tax=Epargyreus clarus TaxID=520877 RepID=UPI003C2DE7DD